MKRTTLAVGLVATVAAGLLAGCSGSSDSGNGSGKKTVGVDYPRSDTDFWNSYIKYVPQFGKQYKLKLKTTNSQNDIANLTANVQTFISQGVKGVVMAPQDTAAIAPALSSLAKKKIPVVSVDTRPDKGKVFMVVRADNKAYGEKACKYLGTRLNGQGTVVMFEGDLSSINGRDRTEAFNSCMKQNYPNVKVLGEETNWKGDVAANKLQTDLTAHPDIKGIYMQAGGAFLAPTLQLLKQKNLLLAPSDPKHIVIVSNDGIPEELKAIAAGQMDATVSQPADLYAKYALFYIKAAVDGKTFKPGKTDHDSIIIKTPQGNLEDQLAAPLVTADGSYPDSLKAGDAKLWGNQIK
jgi:ABC-type sugar transport system substrate-binding protein